MKIRDIEVKHYRIPLHPPFRPAWDHQIRSSFTSTIVRVYTDDGRVGIGSGDAMLGFDNFKHLFIDEVVEQVRKTIGESMEIMVDVNQAWRMPGDTRLYWDFKTAIQFAKALEDYDVYWLEEPLYRDDYTGLAELRKSTRIRIAAGELNRHVTDFREYATHRCVDVIQPDVVVSGGVTQGLKVANLAWHHGMYYSPHSWGDGIGLIANLHIAAGTGICPFIEFPFDPPSLTNEHRDLCFRLRQKSHLTDICNSQTNPALASN